MHREARAGMPPGGSPLTSVIVTVCDHIEYTTLCVESLLACTSPDTYELIVVDNGSGAETQEYLGRLTGGAQGRTSGTSISPDGSAPSVRIIPFDNNLGIAPAWNAGIRAAKGRHLVFVDNDVYFSPGWLDGMLRAFEFDDVWSAVPNMSHIFMPRDFGGRAPDMLGQARLMRPDSLVGSFFMLRRKAVERLGTFDETFGVGPYADLDFDFRLLKSGHRTARVDNVCIHHFEGRTVIDVPGFFDVNEQRNRTYLEQKWQLSEPLPPLSADFEFDLWLQQARSFPGPDVEEIRRRATLDPARTKPNSEGRIIACVNVFNDMKVLPGCLESVKDADLICVVDGAYAAFNHEKPYSTDGTLEYVDELRKVNPRIEVIHCDEPWASEAAKRSAYFIGREGDWYLQVDADERFEARDESADAMRLLRKHLAGCPLDAHFLPVHNIDDGTYTMFPRVYRHQDGITYDAAHWNVVADDRVIAPDWSAPLPISGLIIRHMRQERARDRLDAQTDYYRRMHALEAAEFDKRVAEMEARLTGDPSGDARVLEMLWGYRSAALYNRVAHEQSSKQ